MVVAPEQKRVQFGCKVNPERVRSIARFNEEFIKSNGEVIDALVYYYEEIERIRESILEALEYDLDEQYEAAKERLMSWIEGGLYCGYVPEGLSRDEIHDMRGFQERGRGA